jgi:hypothetical protein
VGQYEPVESLAQKLAKVHEINQPLATFFFFGHQNIATTHKDILVDRVMMDGDGWARWGCCRWSRPTSRSPNYEEPKIVLRAGSMPSGNERAAADTESVIHHLPLPVIFFDISTSSKYQRKKK